MCVRNFDLQIVSISKIQIRLCIKDNETLFLI